VYPTEENSYAMASWTGYILYATYLVSLAFWNVKNNIIENGFDSKEWTVRTGSFLLKLHSWIINF
jgi:hypothetical protein